MALAGYNYAALHPAVYIGALNPITGRGPRWPKRTASRLNPAEMLALGWYRWWGMNDGLTLNINDPQAAIQTSDRGILGQISTGAHGLALASQSKTPIIKFLDWFTKQATKALGPVGGTAEAQTLSLSGTATAAGKAVVVLNDEVYSVPLAMGDTAAAAAAKLADAAGYTPSLAGWTPSNPATTSDIVYTATSPGAKTGQFFVALPAGLSGAFAETTPGTNPTNAAGEITFFDPNGEYGSVQRFSVMIEGVAPAGSWRDEATYTRTIVHQVNQGGTTGLRYDDSGNNAPVALNLAGQAEPRRVSPLELLETGFGDDDQDPYGKATVWRAPLAA